MKDKSQYDFKPHESTVKKCKRYLRITNNMMESKAWENLTCHAMALFMHIKIKYNFTNDDNISFTYVEGKKLMDKKTFTKAIDKLIDNGFIYIVKQGLLKECSIYGFSKEWQYYDTTAFKVKSRVKRMSKPKGDK